MFMLEKADIEGILQAVMSLPQMKFIEELMQQQQQQEQPAPEAPAEAAPQEAAPAEEPVKEQYEQEEEPKEEKDEEQPSDDKEKFGCEEDQETKEPEIGKEKLRMQFDQHKRKYAKLESDYKALYSKVAVIERRERRADRKASLMQLEAEGYVFDHAEELDTVQDYDQAKFSKHCSNIKKNYKKAPVGMNLRPRSEEGGIAQADPHQVMLQAHNKSLRGN